MRKMMSGGGVVVGYNNHPTPNQKIGADSFPVFHHRSDGFFQDKRSVRHPYLPLVLYSSFLFPVSVP